MIDPTLPLIDLHRHLDGSVRLATILDLGFQHELPLPAWDVESLRPHIQVTTPQPGVMSFIAKFKWMTGVLVNEDAVRRIACENVEDAYKEGLDYVELRFSPWFMAEPHHLDPAAVVAAIVDGVEAGQRNFPVRVGLIGILSRTYGPDIAWQELEALLDLKQYLVGLDLAGDEANYPGRLFTAHMEKARQAGWQITIHAGEVRRAGEHLAGHRRAGRQPYRSRSGCHPRSSAYGLHGRQAHRRRSQPDQQCADHLGSQTTPPTRCAHSWSAASWPRSTPMIPASAILIFIMNMM